MMPCYFKKKSFLLLDRVEHLEFAAVAEVASTISEFISELHMFKYYLLNKKNKNCCAITLNISVYTLCL